IPAGLNGGPFKSKPVPAELDWEFWQGQTPRHDYMPERCHLYFRYWLDYFGGTMTDWGAHHNDIALCGIGLGRSGTVPAEGKSLTKPVAGGYTAPSDYEVEYTYANGIRQHCVSTTANNMFGSVARQAKPGEFYHGVKFEGPEGWIFVTRGKIEASKPELIKEPLKSKEVTLQVSNDDMGNFFEFVRSRKATICEAGIGR